MCIAVSLHSHWAASLGSASPQKAKLASAKVPYCLGVGISSRRAGGSISLSKTFSVPRAGVCFSCYWPRKAVRILLMVYDFYF